MSAAKISFFSSAWPVFYEDNHLLVLYKPAGLLVQADHRKEISLLEIGKIWLKERYRKPGRVFLGMVHRLDRTVAGVILFCRTSKAAARVSGQFRSGTVEKTYLAVVEGRVEKPCGQLVHHIDRTAKVSRIVPEPTSSSQEARLSYRLQDTIGSRSLLEVDLETGRRHQIRLQLAHMGTPILGDIRYGASTRLPQRQIALMASRLTIEHPTLRKRMSFESPVPRGWPWPGESDREDDSPPWNWEDLYPAVRPFFDG